MRRLTALTTTLVLAGAMLLVAPMAAQAETMSAPTAKAAATVGGDLRLTWYPVAGASAYRVELSAELSFATVLESVDTYSTTFVPRTALGTAASARPVFWRVAAYGTGVASSSRGAWSATQSTSRAALATPALLTPAAASVVTYPTPVTFVWAPVAGAVSYDLQYSPNAEWGNSVVTKTVPRTTTSFTPTTPLARQSDGTDITWSWRVRANFYSGTMTPTPGTFSDASTFSIVWPASASAPVLTSPAPWVPGAAEVSDLAFTWEPVAGAKNYDLVLGKSQANGLVSDIVRSASVTGTTYVLDLTLTDQTYFWQVTPNDLNSTAGEPSAVRQFQKKWGAQTAPSAATTFEKAAPQALVGTNDPLAPANMPLSEFELSWNPIPRATLYEVVVTPNNGDPQLTCRTAGTSATIIGKVFAGNGAPLALEGSKDCLWSATEAKRIQPGVLYQWDVRGVDYSASKDTTIQVPAPTGTLFSQWSDGDGSDASLLRYFEVSGPAGAAGTVPVLDAARWTNETVGALKGQPAPVFSWENLADARLYSVEVFIDSDLTTKVAEFWTPTARLRPTGVFDDNTTGLPYYWRVRAASATNWLDSITYLGLPTTALSWEKKSMATDFVGVTPVSVSNGATVLSWRPQFASAPNDGGNRGYQVTVRNANNVVAVTAKVEYPFWVAQGAVQVSATGVAGASYKLLPNGSYTFTVAPLDANGNAGTDSAARPFTIAAPAPTGLAATSRRAEATLTWQAPAATDKFELTYWNNATSATTVVLGTSTPLLQTAVSIGDLAPGTYSWIVKSVDKTLNRTSSSVPSSFTVVPQLPAITTANNSVLPAAARVLDWEAVPGASRYLVQVATSSGALATVSPIETVATSLALPLTVAYGTTYYWRVTAVAEKQTSSVSLAARTVIGTSPERLVSFRTTPLAPVQLGPVTSGKYILVSWKALTGAGTGTSTGVQYVVRYRVAASPERAWTTMPATAVGATSSIMWGLTIGGTYEIQVAAKNSEGQGPWSTVMRKLATAPPTGPRSVTAARGDKKVTVKWVVPSTSGGVPITSYRIEQRSYDAKAAAWSAWTTATTVRATVATWYSYARSGLTNGTRYAFRVSALTSAAPQGGALSAVVTAVPAGKPLAPRVTLRATTGKVKVSWKAASSNGSPVTGYYVQYSRNRSTWTTLKATSSTARSYTTTKGTRGKTYYFRVIAKNALGKGTPSGAVAIVKK